jgi:2'-5' RNA ligase
VSRTVRTVRSLRSRIVSACVSGCAICGILVGLTACQTFCRCGADVPAGVNPSLPPLKVSRAAFAGSGEKFSPHANYIALTLPYAPLWPLFEELSRAHGPLLNRGESHVTLLTPPEFESLGGRVPIEKLNALVETLKLQQAKLEPICVGEGFSLLDGQHERVYFVVVQAPRLLEFRREISRLALLAGVKPEAFAPEHFYSHVTLGFSKSDLHEQNGVIKDVKSCRYRLELSD